MTALRLFYSVPKARLSFLVLELTSSLKLARGISAFVILIHCMLYISHPEKNLHALILFGCAFELHFQSVNACLYTHYLFLPWVSGAEGGGEGGGAGLAVPRHAARLRGAADGQSVNAVSVAVAVAVVLLPPAVSRGPHEDGSQFTTSLRHRNRQP